ncbi:hypothetical protein [uncultured Clostridium sp.]|uniref:hypothetical protein n=1 Tax=uncultured Clostridium sp. TaxID=59620 RepID=UPI00261DA477|nr:hypothetical protein [uncultured Clostridium sp.]
MKVRKNISIEEEIWLKGKEKADKMFGGNFSIYLTNLIARDCAGMEIKNELAVTKETKEEIKSELDEEVKSSLDEIL